MEQSLTSTKTASLELKTVEPSEEETFPGFAPCPDLGLHVQTEVFLLGVHFLFQLQLGHLQLCHLTGHPLLV